MSRGGGTWETDQVASPSAFPYQGWLSRPSCPVWPLVVATTSPAAFPALGAGGSPQVCGERAMGPATGAGGSPAAGGSRAGARSPSLAARADWILKATRAECQCECRAAGGRRRGDQDAGAPGAGAGGAGAQLRPPTQPATLPHRHRGLRGPVTPLRGPASFRSAGDHAAEAGPALRFATPD